MLETILEILKDTHKLSDKELKSIGEMLSSYKKDRKEGFWFFVENEGSEIIYNCCFREIIRYFNPVFPCED